jgi:hypothetical protein
MQVFTEIFGQQVELKTASNEQLNKAKSVYLSSVISLYTMVFISFSLNRDGEYLSLQFAPAYALMACSLFPTYIYFKIQKKLSIIRKSLAK